DNRDSNDHRTLLGALPVGSLYFHIDVAVVLVKLAEFVHVLFQLDLIETAGFIHEINWRPAARLHLFAQDFLSEVGVSLEPNLLHRSSDAFVDCENNACCATLFINRIDTKLNANVSESTSLIYVDDFLTRFFQLLFVNRVVEWQFDFFPQSLRLD